MAITFTNLTGDWRRIVEDYITDPTNAADTPGVQGTVTVTPLLGEGRHAPKGVPTDNVFYTLEALDLQVYRGLLRDQNMNSDITVATDIDGYPVAWRAKFDLQYRRQRIPLNDVIFGPGEIIDGKISLSSLVARDGVPPEYEGSYIQLMDAVAAAADSADAAALSASEAADTAESVETAATTVNDHIGEILAAPGHAQDAEDSATAATTQAGIAGGHAVDAAASADAAASSAGEASGSATAAGLSEQSAAAHEQDALDARDDTVVARDAASGSATDAGLSASAAASSATDADGHADRAETAANAFDLTATSSTSAPGTSASVTVTGAGPAYGLDFVIPRGDKGDTGPAGEVSQAELDAAVASLVDGSPGALDTLNELASALGNDPNFATTVSQQIGEKADIGHTHPVADLDTTGTASSDTFLRGDGEWSSTPDTTYAPLSASEAEAGTTSEARTVSASRLRDTVRHWVTGAAGTAVSAIGQALSAASSAAEARSTIGAVSDTDSRLSDARTPTTHSHSYESLTGKPSEFPPATHSHTPAEVGLGNVDNTADADKPVSTAQQAALDAKVQLVSSFPSSPEAGVLYLLAES